MLEIRGGAQYGIWQRTNIGFQQNICLKWFFFSRGKTNSWCTYYSELGGCWCPASFESGTRAGQFVRKERLQLLKWGSCAFFPNCWEGEGGWSGSTDHCSNVSRQMTNLWSSQLLLCSRVVHTGDITREEKKNQFICSPMTVCKHWTAKIDFLLLQLFICNLWCCVIVTRPTTVFSMWFLKD